ncbi:MAG: DUF4920 domain-containing protein [Bacteroidia bacterium]
MKHLLLVISSSVLLLACGNNETESSTSNISDEYDVFGDTISPEGAINIADIYTQMEGKDSAFMKLEGIIYEVCQKKGCWMHVEIDDESDLMVKFRDYEFFVPKDAAGRTVILEGYAYKEIQSIEELKHYAEDAGESDSTIMAITEPEEVFTFMANGVLIKK